VPGSTKIFSLQLLDQQYKRLRGGLGRVWRWEFNYRKLYRKLYHSYGYNDMLIWITLNDVLLWCNMTWCMHLFCLKWNSLFKCLVVVVVVLTLYRNCLATILLLTSCGHCVVSPRRQKNNWGVIHLTSTLKKILNNWGAFCICHSISPLILLY